MWKWILFLIVFSMQAFALTVPFEPVTMNPNDTLQASYSFGNFPIIFCLDTNQKHPHGVIIWPYQGQLFSSTLPIFLKINPIYSGEFADPNGTITVQNNTGAPIYLSCLFGF